MSGGSTIQIDRLRRTFRTGGADIVAVDDLTMTVRAGSLVAITGPSGSGKSTLLHLIGAIERPDSGTITADEIEVTGLRRTRLAAYRRSIGFVFQRYHLLPALTALDNVVAPVLPYKVDFRKADRARELLAAVDLEGRENALPAQLSGGQQQRVAIARALIGRPRLLLADEPTGNLDSKSGGEILNLIADLRATYGMTVLVATHEQRIAARADRVLRLRDGAVVEDLDLQVGHPASDTLTRLDQLRA
ncbi:ABC transporter ATP-binding protein [Kribbella sp. NPDC003505]|uniref:ABC transporter ATP-binding protein n=1 Tax=Kribbella sp. NPDC003505 TaxID=3154448 RepID=UPI0033AE4091